MSDLRDRLIAALVGERSRRATEQIIARSYARIVTAERDSARRQLAERDATIARVQAAADPIRRALREVAEYGDHGWYGYVTLDDVRDLIAALDQPGGG